ncbi:MAG TPA: hypothetical protein PK641_00840 [Candidatus Enterocola sp.]|nr:hypothetical protein [Candidatus Enterocola sp.]
MNFVQTLYMSPDNNLFHDSFGWVALEYHLMSWALSCLLLKRSYTNVKLYANAEVAKCLTDYLKLPYDEVHILSDKFKLPHPSLWALPKLWTYSLQEEPFLHVDALLF